MEFTTLYYGLLSYYTTIIHDESLWLFFNSTNNNMTAYDEMRKMGIIKKNGMMMNDVCVCY